jgi:hypothetical protein
MALVTKGTYMTVVVVDAAGNRSTLRYELTYANLAALSTAVTAGDLDGLLADLNAVTDGRVVAYQFGEKFAENADFYGAAGSQVENIALISAKIDGEPNKVAQVRVPAPAIGIFLGTTGKNANIVDIADADILAYLDNFANAGDDIVQVSDGESLADPATAGNWEGKRIHRGSRKG